MTRRASHTRCKQDSVTPVPCQDKREEPEDSGVGQRKVAKTSSIHPTRQEVLLIEGCVLQLLRVEVVKDVSPDISQKKVSLLQRRRVHKATLDQYLVLENNYYARHTSARISRNQASTWCESLGNKWELMETQGQAKCEMKQHMVQNLVSDV